MNNRRYDAWDYVAFVFCLAIVTAPFWYQAVPQGAGMSP